MFFIFKKSVVLGAGSAQLEIIGNTKYRICSQIPIFFQCFIAKHKNPLGIVGGDSKYRFLLRNTQPSNLYYNYINKFYNIDKTSESSGIDCVIFMFGGIHKLR